MCTCIRPMNIKSTDHELAFTHAKGLNAYMSYRILENWMLQCLNYSSPSPGLPLATTCTSLGTRPLNSACTQSQVCTTHFMTTLRLSTALWSGVWSGWVGSVCFSRSRSSRIIRGILCTGVISSCAKVCREHSGRDSFTCKCKCVREYTGYIHVTYNSILSDAVDTARVYTNDVGMEDQKPLKQDWGW